METRRENSPECEHTLSNSSCGSIHPAGRPFRAASGSFCFDMWRGTVQPRSECCSDANVQLTCWIGFSWPTRCDISPFNMFACVCSGNKHHSGMKSTRFFVFFLIAFCLFKRKRKKKQPSGKYTTSWHTQRNIS